MHAQQLIAENEDALKRIALRTDLEAFLEDPHEAIVNAFEADQEAIAELADDDELHEALADELANIMGAR